MTELLKSFWTDESGQGLTEYAVLIGLITLAVIAVIILLGTQIKRIFQLVVNNLTTVSP